MFAARTHDSTVFWFRVHVRGYTVAMLLQASNSRRTMDIVRIRDC